MRIAVVASFLVALAVGPLGAAQAATEMNGFGSNPPAGGSWNFFQWAADGNSEVFVISTDIPLKLRVTDGFCRGDRFDIFDNGVFLGRTRSVPIDAECDDVPDQGIPERAWRDPTYSHTGGWLNLAPGDHSVQFYASTNPFLGGGAWYGLGD